MGAIWMRGRADLRTRWRSVVLMVVVVAVGGGTALTALAGARRTDAAMGQFVVYSLPDDGGFASGSVVNPPVAPGLAPGSLAPDPVATKVLALPHVVAYFRAPFLYVATDRRGASPSTLTVTGVLDPDFLHTVDRPLVLAGRLPPPGDPSAAVVNEFAASARHLRVGSVVHLYAYSFEQVQSGGLTGGPNLGAQAPAGPAFTVRVAAVVRSPQEVDAVRPLADRQGVPYESQQTLYVTPGFVQHYAAGLGVPVAALPNSNLFSLRLRRGASDWPAFVRAANAASGGSVFLSSGNTFGVHLAAASAQRGIHIVVIALVGFGALVAVLTLVLVGQALARQVALDTEDVTVMRALGSGRRDVVAFAALRAGIVGTAGAALAGLVAWSASPIMPVGLAREAEVRPGLSFDPLVVVLGALALAVLLVPWASFPAWRRARTPVAVIASPPVVSERGSLAGALARAGAPSPAHIGIGFGLERERVRGGAFTAAFAAVVAVAALAGSFTVGASLSNLEGAPRQQGWNWNVLVGNPNSFINEERSYARLLDRDRFVSGFSAIAILAGASQGNATVDGKLLNLMLAFDPLKGDVYPPLLQGRAPRAADEVVLASRTMTLLHKRIGQSVETGGPTGGPIRLRIVGTMIAPSVGDLFTNGMGEGAWVYGPAVRAAVQQQLQEEQSSGSQSSVPPTVFNVFAVRFAPGTSEHAALATLRQQFGPVVLEQIPAQDVVNLQSVDRLPLLLAVLVVLLGVATIGNSLVGAIRHHRRDIAVLKTMGFLRRQVAATVAWQATAMSVVALVVGLPVGVAVGRWAWTAIASGMGSASPPLVPVLAVALVAPAAIAVANAVAAGPGWAAARIAPAVVMRSE